MDGVSKALEITGTIDEHRQLHLDTPLPIVGPSRVRVIILISEEAKLNEVEWLQSAARNPAFDFLKDPEEDIYTLSIIRRELGELSPSLQSEVTSKLRKLFEL